MGILQCLIHYGSVYTRHHSILMLRILKFTAKETVELDSKICIQLLINFTNVILELYFKYVKYNNAKN